MSSTVIYLIRHSIPEYQTNAKGELLTYGPDARLTEEGKQRARNLADAILSRENGPLDVIFSSPFTRTYETALILTEAFKLSKLLVVEELHDVKSSWAGMPKDKFMEITFACKTYDDPHSLESLVEVAERMVKAYRQILAEHADQRIGIVSHEDPLRVLYDQICHPYRNIPPYPLLVQELSLDFAQALRLEISDGKVSGKEMLSGVSTPDREGKG